MTDPSSCGSFANSQSGQADAGMFSTALGGIGKAFGAITEGQDTKALYDYQAGIANLNAQIANQNAEYSIQVGEHQAMQAGLAGASTLGKIKAAQGASGLDVNSGSALDVQTSQQLINRMDQATIRSNAAKVAYNYRVEGVGLNAQAQLDTLAGKNAATTGYINAASSILGGASSVSQQWLKESQLTGGSAGGGAGSTDQTLSGVY